MIADLISRLDAGMDLTHEQAGAATSEMLLDRIPTDQCVRFLGLLTAKGETDDELLGMLEAMQDLSLGLDPGTRDGLIDMCGTGGDGLWTFNVSTAASFVAAAAGVPVAKHGNRSNTGVSGSADVFEHLGCDLNAGPEQLRAMLDESGLCFMFAPRFHPAMRSVAPARRQIPHRTAFNILGPLSNPACVRNQLIGVSSGDLLIRLPRILSRRGSTNVMTVMAGNGMDEFSTATRNRVCIMRDGAVREETVDPQDLGLHESSAADIQIETKGQAMEAFIHVMDGTASRAMIETAALNAAAGLIVGGAADGFGDATDAALDTIASGRAHRFLAGFVGRYGNPGVLEAKR